MSEIKKCDFTLEHYFDTLEKATQELGYTTSTISKVFKMFNEQGISKFILLRHDVDLSLDYAVKLAEEEAKRGYYSTYYVLLHAPTYNALSPKGMEQIRKISQLGHEVGLHLDTRYQIPDEHLLLQDILGTGQKIESYSNHYPSLRDKGVMPNLMDAYSLHNYGIKYISDSGRHWREGCLCQNLDRYERMQVLTHPIWWVACKKPKGYQCSLAALGERLSDNAFQDVDDYRTILKDYIKNEIGIKV